MECFRIIVEKMALPETFRYHAISLTMAASRYNDWRMSAEVLSQALPIACALLLVRFIAAEVVRQRALPTKDGQRFPVGIGVRVTLRVGGPLLLYVAYKMSEQASSTFDYIAALAVTLLGCGCVFGEPGQIAVSRRGIVQSSMLGLVRKEIDWHNAAASAPLGLSEVLVVGGDGRTITHSKYHVGQGEFISQLRQHGVSVQGQEIQAR